MERILSTQLPEHAGERVRIAGWLHRQRRLKSVTFLIVRDAGGLAQVVITDAELNDRVASWCNETVVTVTGAASANPQAPGGVEIIEPTVEVLATVDEPPPLELFRPEMNAGLPALLDNAAVALRHPRRQAIFRIAAASVAGFRRTLDAARFIEIQTPKIVASATESGANVFGIDYFGQRAFLAQSPQFYKQAMVGVFERVYEVGPVFRAEPHDTARHLAQYTSLDAEMGFIDDHTSVMAMLGTVIRGMLDTVTETYPNDIATAAIEWPLIPDVIPVVHFAEAQRMITGATGEDLGDEPDLAPAHERWLGEWALREHGSDFVFVTGYPMAKRPFYTHPQPGAPEFSNSFDLLFRGLELVTGGQRLHRHADYLAALAARGESPDAYTSYLDTFRNGMPPHGGFAIGLERWVARLTGAANIRETTLFPRDLHRLTP